MWGFSVIGNVSKLELLQRTLNWRLLQTQPVLMKNALSWSKNLLINHKSAMKRFNEKAPKNRTNKSEVSLTYHLGNSSEPQKGKWENWERVEMLKTWCCFTDCFSIFILFANFRSMSISEKTKLVCSLHLKWVKYIISILKIVWQHLISFDWLFTI